jgi:hypothetical protein
MMMATPSTRRALAEYLSSQASWRSVKAEEYPEDKRNAEWSDRLRRLSAWITTLPDTHDDLKQIDRIWGRYGLDVFSTAGPDTDEYVSRPNTDNFDSWLAQFTDAFTDESINAEAETGDEYASLISLAQEQDPAIALRAVRALSYATAEWEEEAVLRARVEGYPWSRIAALLGKGRQTVWKKYRDPDELESDQMTD